VTDVDTVYCVCGDSIEPDTEALCSDCWSPRENGYRRRIAEFEALLREVEWKGRDDYPDHYPCCPFCDSTDTPRYDGDRGTHKPDCRWVKVMGR
jgi:hypothetical protein